MLSFRLTTAMLTTMRGKATGDVLKVWLYVITSVWLGAWISPLTYQTGQAINEVASVKQTNAGFKWLAAICDRASFADFFAFSLFAAGLLLFIPFIDWIRGGRFAKDGKILRLIRPVPSPDLGGLQKNPLGIREALLGFGWMAAGFLMISGGLSLAGLFEWKHPPPAIAPWLGWALIWALLAGILQEFLFGGIATGIFLRALNPPAALGLSALLFAGVHLLNPSAGLPVADPELPAVGFELLRKIGGQFFLPREVICQVLPLLVFGGLLAYTRWRTNSLFLPIGLHVGWLFADALVADGTVISRKSGALVWLMSENSTRSGLIPLAAMLAASYGILRLLANRHGTHLPS
jgi:membrane protease YdiL (CAAX protease family)